MKIVVVGGTGLVGRRMVALLKERGHEVVVASPSRGVDTYSGTGVADALHGAQVVVDVTNPKDWEDGAVMDFFTVSTRNLLAASAEAGVNHYMILSVVGAGRVPDSGYLRAKTAQEALIRESGVPHTIVAATQFHEFVDVIAHVSTVGDAVRVPAAYIQPVAAADVSAALAELAVLGPRNDTVELGGPERFRFAELMRLALGTDRHIVEDPTATYFGARLEPEAIVPAKAELTGELRYEDWRKAGAASRE